MRKQLIILSIFILFLIPFSALAEENDCIYYFYSEDCESCPDVSDFLDRLNVRYPKVTMEKFEAYYNPEHAQLLKAYFTAYSVPEESQGIPVIFIQNSYLVGNTSIMNLVEGSIKENSFPGCPSLEDTDIVGVVGEDKSPGNVMETLSFAMVASTAFEDSVRPGIIAILLVLVLLLSLIKEDKKLLIQGGLFIATVYLLYLLSGLGLFVGFSGYFFSKAVGFLVLVLGIVWFKAFFSPLKFVKQIPEKYKKMGSKVEKIALSGIGFVIIAGLLTIFTTANTNKMFTLLRDLFSGGEMRVFSLLIYYCFIIILPLLVLSLIFYAVRRKFVILVKKNAKHKEELWQQYYGRLLNFVVSIILIIVGFVLLFV